jgi:hypothetical protein
MMLPVPIVAYYTPVYPNVQQRKRIQGCHAPKEATEMTPRRGLGAIKGESDILKVVTTYQALLTNHLCER